MFKIIPINIVRLNQITPWFSIFSFELVIKSKNEYVLQVKLDENAFLSDVKYLFDIRQDVIIILTDILLEIRIHVPYSFD